VATSQLDQTRTSFPHCPLSMLFALNLSEIRTQQPIFSLEVHVVWPYAKHSKICLNAFFQLFSKISQFLLSF